MIDCNPRYTLRFFDRGGRVIDGPKDIEMLHWQRKLDDSSKADWDLIISGDDCCGELGRIEPLAHAVEIKRNAKQVWYGWVLDIEEGRRTFNFTAFDAIGWLKRRKIHTDMSWSVEEVVNIFQDIWDDAMAPDPIRAQVILSPTGTLETRSVKVSENQLAWAAVKQMLDSGLDITAFGQTVLAGIVHTTKPIELKLSDFEGDVRLSKLGSQFSNNVTVDASEQIQAIYPDTPPSANDYYPLVETVVKDAGIEDVNTAINTAKSRYEYSRFVPRILTNTENLTLRANIDIDVNDLIPGIRVIVDTEGLCTETRQEFRLGQVDFNVVKGSEKITVSLQPTGPRDNLDSALDPIL